MLAGYAVNTFSLQAREGPAPQTHETAPLRRLLLKSISALEVESKLGKGSDGNVTSSDNRSIERLAELEKDKFSRYINYSICINSTI